MHRIRYPESFSANAAKFLGEPDIACPPSKPRL
jgi:hypothetical protein